MLKQYWLTLLFISPNGIRTRIVHTIVYNIIIIIIQTAFVLLNSLFTCSINYPPSEDSHFGTQPSRILLFVTRRNMIIIMIIMTIIKIKNILFQGLSVLIAFFIPPPSMPPRPLFLSPHLSPLRHMLSWNE